jgi:hypothetical protein
MLGTPATGDDMADALTAEKKTKRAKPARRTFSVKTADGEVQVKISVSPKGRHSAVAFFGPGELSPTSRALVKRLIRLRDTRAIVRFTRRPEPRRSTPASAEEVTRGDLELDELRRSLVARFSPSIEDLDPVPRGTVEQARRFALLAAELMREGAYDHEALAEGWGMRVDAARKRVQRAADRYELFTVSYKDRAFVPGFLLDERLKIRSELAPIIATLTAAGEGGFALWAWLTAPSAWLDGKVPHEVAKTDTERVVRAAAQRASTAW